MNAGAGEDGRCSRCIAKAVRRFAKTLALALQDAEDCEVGFFAHVWRDGACALAPESATPGPCDRVAEVRRCAHNYVIDYARGLASRRRHEQLWPLTAVGAAWEPPDSSPGPEDNLLRNEAAGALDRAVEQLDERQREVLARFYWRQESCAEIADALGTTPHSVEQDLYRARRHLRAILERHGHTADELLSGLSPPSADHPGRSPPPTFGPR